MLVIDLLDTHPDSVDQCNILVYLAISVRPRWKLQRSAHDMGRCPILAR